VTSNLESSYGGISLRLGKLTELIVVPKLRRNMNAQGHNFEQAKPDALIRGVIGGGNGFRPRGRANGAGLEPDEPLRRRQPPATYKKIKILLTCGMK
jgi:hypothetical protein